MRSAVQCLSPPPLHFTSLSLKTDSALCRVVHGLHVLTGRPTSPLRNLLSSGPVALSHISTQGCFSSCSLPRPSQLNSFCHQDIQQLDILFEYYNQGLIIYEERKPCDLQALCSIELLQLWSCLPRQSSRLPHLPTSLAPGTMQGQGISSKTASSSSVGLYSYFY